MSLSSTIPDSTATTNNGMCCGDATGKSSGDCERIPIIDFLSSQGNGDRHALACQLADKLHSVGFVILTNHGISHELIDKVFDISDSFFKLPIDEKKTIDKRSSKHFRGWEPVGAESTNGQADWREQIDFWTECTTPPPLGDDHVDSYPIYYNLKGKNQWPSFSPEFRPTVEEYYNEITALGDQLIRLFAEGLGLSSNSSFHKLFFDAESSDDRMSLIKLISYPKTPEGSFGVHAHHDTGFLTILSAGVTPGLQVQSIRTGNWMDVPVIPHSFVINIGEALQHITGNYFVATPHRVRASAARLSCGFFYGPSLDTPLATLPDLPRALRAKVEESEYHRKAGFMTQEGTSNTEDGEYANYGPGGRPKTWGALIWNYLSRSYPDIMKQHYNSSIETCEP